MLIFVLQLDKGLLGCGTDLPLEIELSLNDMPISNKSKYEQYSDITKSSQRDTGKLMRCNCKETCGKTCIENKRFNSTELNREEQISYLFLDAIHNFNLLKAKPSKLPYFIYPVFLLRLEISLEHSEIITLE